MMDWLKIARTYEQEYIEKTQALLRIPTVLEKYDPNNIDEPFGRDIKRALDFVLTMAEIDGFKTRNVMNHAGHIELGEGKDIIGILTHIDVVPTGGKWDSDPFGAIVRDGKIFARGAIDDKGPTMASYLALKMIKDQGVKLNKRVRLIIGCDEESGMRCIKKYKEYEDLPDIGFSPDAEFPLIYAEKGNFSFDVTGLENDDLIASINAGERYNVVPDECVAVLKKDVSAAFRAWAAQNGRQIKVEGDRYTVYGKNAHGAWPMNGLNAIFLMADFLKTVTTSGFVRFLDKHLTHDHFGVKLGIDTFDPEMKELTLNTAIVRYADGAFRIGCNIRFPRNFEFAKKTAKIGEAAAAFGFTYVPQRHSEPHYVSPTDPLVKTLEGAYRKYTGDVKNPIFTIGGGTYARELKKAVAFGPCMPGDEEMAHQPNEYVVIQDMLVAAAIYAESIEILAGAAK